MNDVTFEPDCSSCLSVKNLNSYSLSFIIFEQPITFSNNPLHYFRLQHITVDRTKPYCSLPYNKISHISHLITLHFNHPLHHTEPPTSPHNTNTPLILGCRVMGMIRRTEGLSSEGSMVISEVQVVVCSMAIITLYFIQRYLPSLLSPHHS